MKFTEPWGRQRLSFLLEKAVSREAKMWKAYVSKKPLSQDTDISPEQRDEAVRWMTELHGRLQLYPETLVLAVSILDRFLAPIKFHAMVLSGRSGLLDSTLGLNLSQHLALLTQRLYHCLADHTLLQLRGSMLALALITLELETCCPDWLALTIDLLGKAQINSSELIRGREMVARSLSTLRASLPANTVYIYHTPPLPRCTSGTIASTSDSTRDHSPAAAAEDEEGSCGSSSCISDAKLPVLLSAPKPLCPLTQLVATLRCKASTKRKVEQMDVDDFYDGIKRLYNEDNPNTTIQEGAAPAAGGRGLSMLSTPCPPLQPVSSS
ncbi:cyclin-I isoform X2 [Oryzias melastigma]|uniref:cyclin-I isoform X2 n=1 Tax=Oryzias melastigma TaxID=30732 RepID=UPI00168D4C8C|nr:cyclin-I isoform X2 [Oryzias melastigma]